MNESGDNAQKVFLHRLSQAVELTNTRLFERLDKLGQHHDSLAEHFEKQVLFTMTLDSKTRELDSKTRELEKKINALQQQDHSSTLQNLQLKMHELEAKINHLQQHERTVKELQADASRGTPNKNTTPQAEDRVEGCIQQG